MSRDVVEQLDEYFTFVDEVQRAVDPHGIVDLFQPAHRVQARQGMSRWWLAGAAAVAAIALLALIPVLLRDDPDVEPIGTPIPTPTATAEPTATPEPIPAPDPGLAIIVDTAGSVLFTHGTTVDSGDDIDPWIRQKVLDEIGSMPELGATVEDRLELLASGGLTVHLSLDPVITTFAARSLGNVPNEFDATSITVDNDTGNIVAAVSRSGSSLGIAQPADSAQLAVFAAAFESGLRSDVQLDGTSPCAIDFDGTTYAFENLGLATGDTGPLWDHIRDHNTCALARLDSGTVSSMLDALTDTTQGSTRPIVDPPRLTALEHAAMMAVIANDGINPGFGLVTEVLNASGDTLFRRTPGEERILDSDTADALIRMGPGTLNPFPTGVGSIGVPVAGIGSNPANTSANWIVATAHDVPPGGDWTGGITSAIWIAHPDGAPMHDLDATNITDDFFATEAFWLLHRRIRKPSTELPAGIGEIQPHGPISDAPLLVTTSINVDEPPGVPRCNTLVPRGVGPPDQGGPVTDAGVHPSPRTALAAFLQPTAKARAAFAENPGAFNAPGVIGDPPVATAGYVELVLPDGSIHYTQPHPRITADFASVALISTRPTTSGWTISQWEAPGC